MKFSDVLGQKIAKRSLQAVLSSGRVAQAYLFWGMPGVGKRTLARVFARALLCEGLEPKGACGECRACRLAAAGSHPDWHVPGGGDLTLGIADVRGLQQALRYKPYGRRHVVSLERAERLTLEAANALLKILEEPGGEVVFVLTADRPEAVPATVRSRCLHLPCRPLSRSEVLRGLEQAGIDGPRAALLAARAGGSLGRALELAAGDGKDAEPYRAMVRWAGEIGKLKVVRLLEIAEEFGSRETADKRLEFLLYWLRDVLLWKETASEETIVNIGDLAEIQRQSAFFTSLELAAGIRAVEKARQLLAANVNPQLVIDNLLLKLNSIVSRPF
ncbi:MAG: ATP-binding protein [Bacillota bacterium]